MILTSDLVEQSFRLANEDLAARPVYLHSEQRINTHLTTVMAALAHTRDLQDRTGSSIRRILHALEPLRSSRIRFGDQTLEFPPDIPQPARQILESLDTDVKAPTGRQANLRSHAREEMPESSFDLASRAATQILH